jgi:hypothetical protein
VYKVASAPVKLAATTVVVTTETAGAAVKATGKVATSAFNAVGSVGSTGIDSAAKLTETGMVTFVDVATGTIVRVPWRQGATLASASADARLLLARRTIDIVRAGHVVLSSAHPSAGLAEVASGDVVRLRG